MHIVKTFTSAAAVIAISVTAAQAGAPSSASLDNALSASGFATQSYEFQHTSTDRSNTGEVMNYRTHFKSGNDNIVVLSDKNGKPFQTYKATYLINTTSNNVQPFVLGNQG